ncbi:hypothetical protein [Nitrosococcus wardiae]|uniref:SPOR domain-containing protein n=1 Tax=Nitrosococcus wardiae TaxID=1814290 RepID=A0A4P7BYB8_9GAMM|nr:hypothetical protein [Nitrosococcus wardiae]QBQ54160.1 hypothetical protein E3U44_06315 [Nitrosococcus wardiae]
MTDTQPMVEKTTPPRRPLEIRIRITYPRATPEKAPSHNQGKAPRKRHPPWVVPMVLILLLGGLLLSLYAHQELETSQTGTPIETLPPVAPAPKKTPTEAKLKKRVEARASRQEQNPSAPKVPVREKPGTTLKGQHPPALVKPEATIVRAQFTTAIREREPLDQIGPVILAKEVEGFTAFSLH